jgi:hypothetical protein
MDALQDRGYEPELAICKPDYRTALSINKDTEIFIKGLIVGVGIAGAAGAIFSLISMRNRGKSGSQAGNGEPVGLAGVITGVTDLVTEGTSAFRDAVDALDRTFESGVNAYERVQEAMSKRQ